MTRWLTPGQLSLLSTMGCKAHRGVLPVPGLRHNTWPTEDLHLREIREVTWQEIMQSKGCNGKEEGATVGKVFYSQFFWSSQDHVAK